jgi:hypothetical protein
MASYAAAARKDTGKAGDSCDTENRCHCDLCRADDPRFFAQKHFGNMGYTYVFQRPRRAMELRAYREELHPCPFSEFGYKLI